MKKIIHKIASFTLALIVLFSSFSFTVNQHICGGEVASTTFFIDADDCGMSMDKCENKLSNKQTSLDKEPCCKDVSTVIQGNQNNQQAQQFNLEIPSIEFVATFVYTYVAKFQETTSVFSFVNYKSPLVYKNIQTLFQVFRI